MATIEVKLTRTNVLTRWDCTVCGGCTDKVEVLAEADAVVGVHSGVVRVCERCLERGQEYIDHEFAQVACRWAVHEEACRSLRLKVPTFEEWLVAEEICNDERFDPPPVEVEQHRKFYPYFDPALFTKAVIERGPLALAQHAEWTRQWKEKLAESDTPW
jgi:hypothetical protein